MCALTHSISIQPFFFYFLFISSSHTISHIDVPRIFDWRGHKLILGSKSQEINFGDYTTTAIKMVGNTPLRSWKTTERQHFTTHSYVVVKDKHRRLFDMSLRTAHGPRLPFNICPQKL